MKKGTEIKKIMILEQKQKGKSLCCNAEVINWLGNVTAVMFGAAMPKANLKCMRCGKATTKNE